MMLRLSCALWPSKPANVLTPFSGPVSGAATGSTLPLLIEGPAALAVGDCRSLPCEFEPPPPIAISENGFETSWREALMTSGSPANASDAVKINKEHTNHLTRRTSLARFIEPPRDERDERAEVRGDSTTRGQPRQAALV